jgi:hypothetical protein
MLAVFTVSNLNDAGAGSLRDAITMANVDSIADTIDFSVTGQIDIASQLPTITESVTITGPGADQLTIDAGDGTDNTFGTGDGFRIFDIDDGTGTLIDVTLSGLTLTGGDTANGADGDGFFGTPAENGANGGAIRSQENLTLINSAISGNATGAGGKGYKDGLSGDGGFGGGILSSGGALTITDSTISGNATGDGGDGGLPGSVFPGGSGGDGGIGGGISSFGEF